MRSVEQIGCTRLDGRCGQGQCCNTKLINMLQELNFTCILVPVAVVVHVLECRWIQWMHYAFNYAISSGCIIDSYWTDHDFDWWCVHETMSGLKIYFSQDIISKSILHLTDKTHLGLRMPPPQPWNLSIPYLSDTMYGNWPGDASRPPIMNSDGILSHQHVAKNEITKINWTLSIFVEGKFLNDFMSIVSLSLLYFFLEQSANFISQKLKSQLNSVNSVINKLQTPKMR